MKLFVVFFVVAFSVAPAFSEVGVFWVSQLEENQMQPDEAQKIEGAPDGELTRFSNGSRVISSSVFSTRISYTAEEFAALLNVSVEDLLRSDFIAFEFNGPQAPALDFETSTWSFSASGQTEEVTITFGQTDPNVIEGSIETEPYETFFGFESVGEPGRYTFALFNLQTVSPEGENFRVEVSSLGESQPSPTSPDIDAMGIVCDFNTKVDIEPAHILSFETKLNLVYILESSENGESFSKTENTIIGTGEKEMFCVPRDRPKELYRVVVSLEVPSE